MKTSEVVERLAALRQEKDELEAEEARLVSFLGKRKGDEFEGNRFKAIVSRIGSSYRTDWQGICAKLSPSPQLVAAHRTPTAAYVRIRIVELEEA